MNSHIRTASTKDCKTGCLRAKKGLQIHFWHLVCFRVCITVSGSVCTIFIIIIITWQLCSEASYLQVVASVHLHFLAQVQTVLSSHGILWSQSTEKCPMCSRNVCSNSQHTIFIRRSVALTYTHTRLTALCPGLPRWASTRKVKPIWTLLKQETVRGSGISWAICKCAPRTKQITTPAPHHSDFYRPDALPVAQPTASKHWRDSMFNN